VTVTSPTGKISAHVAFNPGSRRTSRRCRWAGTHAVRQGRERAGENPLSLLPAGESYALQATRVALAKTKLSIPLARTGHPEGSGK